MRAARLIASQCFLRLVAAARLPVHGASAGHEAATRRIRRRDGNQPGSRLSWRAPAVGTACRDAARPRLLRALCASIWYFASGVPRSRRRGGECARGPARHRRDLGAVGDLLARCGRQPTFGWTVCTIRIVALAVGIVLAMPTYSALYLRRSRPGVVGAVPTISRRVLRSPAGGDRPGRSRKAARAASHPAHD